MDISLIGRRLGESGELKRRLAIEQAGNIDRAGRAIAASLAHGRKVLLFGNGGSAADAQHIAAEFVGRFTRDRVPLPAIALTTDTSALTAIGNDYGFEQVFARQVQAIGKSGDLAVAISTSGRSPNVLAGVEAARRRGVASIGLTGGDGGLLARIVDIPIVVPSVSTSRIQECHITVGHILCEIVEVLMFENPNRSTSDGTCDLPLAGRKPKVLEWDTLLSLRERWRIEKKTVVWTNGCFDLLHMGHIRALNAARSLGDLLVVGVNGDSSVEQLKGSGRPIVPASQRVEILAALECVDHVIVFDEVTPVTALSRLKPDIHCRNADRDSQHGKDIPEAALIESYGGHVRLLPLFPSVSTSALMQRVRELK